jgi:hypothetical protein
MAFFIVTAVNLKLFLYSSSGTDRTEGLKLYSLPNDADVTLVSEHNTSGRTDATPTQLSLITETGNPQYAGSRLRLPTAERPRTLYLLHKTTSSTDKLRVKPSS